MRLIKKIRKNIIVRNIVKHLLNPSKKVYMIFCNKVYGVSSESIVFVSFGGKSYSDNPKAISERLHEIKPKTKIFWLFIDPNTKESIVPDYVTSIRANSFKALKALATSKFWVDNFNKPLYMYKSKEQVYIQTWHGDRGFKKILYDAWPNRKRPMPLLESDMCDLMVSGSLYGEKKFRSAFKYDGEILKKGCPRNDVLINAGKEEIIKLKEKNVVKADTKILTYAPTLRKVDAREGSLQNTNDIDLKKALLILEEKTNKKWICYIRSHSAVKGLKGIKIDNNKIFNGNRFEDMNDLLLISDILITDYSSSAGDFTLLRRPVILYQPDRENYSQEDRNFYFDVNKSPFMIANSNEDLLRLIEDIDNIDVEENCKDILDFYGTYETGKATEAVSKYIISEIN